MFTIVHAIIGYFYLLLTVRVLVRRPGAQMTPFEFVIVFLIGGVIILTTIGEDRSETNSVCAIITVALMHRLVASLARKHPRIGMMAYGIPIVVLKNGEWQQDMMTKMSIYEEDVMAAARTKGVKNLGEIKYAILERNGAISILT